MIQSLAVLFVLTLVRAVTADYQCVCNYAQSATVFSSTNGGGQVHTMNEYECQPLKTESGSWAELEIIGVPNAYVRTGGNIMRQTCPGNKPTPTTTITTTTTTTTTPKTTTTTTTKPTRTKLQRVIK